MGNPIRLTEMTSVNDDQTWKRFTVQKDSFSMSLAPAPEIIS
jgi:hypothetical protein